MIGAVTTSSEIESIISKASAAYGVPKALIKATIKVESDYNPSAFRQEPHLKDASWGLMQILLSTAKWITKNPDLTASALMQPEFNVYTGTKYLSYLLGKYPSIKDVIAAYNAGSPRHNKDGTYVNQAYVDKSYKWYLIYKGTETVTQSSVGLPLIAIGAVAIAMMSRR